MKPLPIRTHLLLLVLAMSIPLVAMVGFGIYSDTQTEIARTKASLQTALQIMATKAGDKVADVRHTLKGLAERPLVQQLDPRKCDGILKDLLTLNPAYADVTLATLDGQLICPAAARLGDQPVQVGHKPEFQNFLKNQRFTVFEPFFGSVSGKWVSVLSAPIWNQRHEMMGAVQISMDNSAFDPNIPATFLPDDSRYGYFSANGTLIWRNQDTEGIIGTRPHVPGVQQVLDLQSGEIQSAGVDGVMRHVAFRSIPETGWIAWVGVPIDTIYAPAWRRALTSTAIALGSLGLILLLANVIARRIARPIAALERTAQAVQDDDLGAQVAVAGPREVVAVAQTFKATMDRIRASTRQLQGEVSERKQAEAALKKSQQLLSETERIGKVGGWEFDIDSGTQAWTDETLRIHELEPPYEPTLARELDFYTVDSRPLIESAVRQAIIQGEPFDLSLDLNTAKGRVRHVHVVGRPDLENRRVFGFIQDVTEAKQAEAAHALLEAKLRESQKLEALGTLAGGVAHDFNNALAAILGNLELARQDVGPDHAAIVSLDEIGKASRRAKDLVQQILAFGRRQTIRRLATSLSLVVVESARLIRATLPAEIALHIDCRPDAPAVLADATQIKQILLNLCQNAMHSIRGQERPGEIEIRLSAHVMDEARRDELRPGRYACLSVRDNGAGMDQATRQHIFEPFFSTKPKGQGTGLGLSVVHGIAQAHEARIEVDSTPGKGTEFRIYFPAVEATVPERATPTPVTPIQGAGKHVLFVDDENAIVFLMKHLLTRQGFRVSGYTDPAQALAAVRADAGQFDVVVTDFNMPHMSGLELAQALKEIRPDLPVVLASGYITEELRQQAPAAGVRELIYKPDTVDDLCAAVARCANIGIGRS